MDETIKKIYSIYQKHNIVCTDTRELKKDSIFFALKGENFNGNAYAEQAINSGCAYAVIDDTKFYKDDRYIIVNDVLASLQELAKFHRSQLSIPFIAITGTNGKTTTKELISSVLSKKYNTCSTKGNLNNHIGVPLTILSVNKSHEIAVIEMGANHIGEIAALCEIAQPDYGIITNIGKAHLEGFGSLEGVIKAKSELYEFIHNHNGSIFINTDNKLLSDLAKGINKKISYSSSTNSTITGKLIDHNPFVTLHWKMSDEGKNSANEEIITTQIVGKYNFENILSAICIGNYFNVSKEHIQIALEDYIPSNSRSQVIQKNTNTILLDAYNANPTSMVAAIENFYEMNCDNKMLILGDMLELGKDSHKEHQQIIELLKNKGLANTLLIGNHFSETENSIHAKHFNTSDEAKEYLQANKIENTTILIKGSRGIKLEKILEAF